MKGLFCSKKAIFWVFSRRIRNVGHSQKLVLAEINPFNVYRTQLSCTIYRFRYSGINVKFNTSLYSSQQSADLPTYSGRE